MLKTGLLKREINTEDLVILLGKEGVQVTKSSINSKISRGTFSAAFLLQVLQVIGCKKFDIISPIEMNLKVENQLQSTLAQ